MSSNKISKQTLIEDLQETAKKVEGLLTVTDYLEYGNHSPATVFGKNGRWDTWDEARFAAGLQTGSLEYSDEQLLDDVRRVYRDHVEEGMYFLSSVYAQYGGMSLNTVDNRFGGWRAALREAGILEENKEEMFENWARILKEDYSYNRVTLEELKSVLPSFNTQFWAEFNEWVSEEKKELYLRPRKNSNNAGRVSVFVKDLSSGDGFKEKILDKYGSDIDSVYNHILMHMVSEGRSPATTVAAIKYITEDLTQKEAAKMYDVSPVSVRNSRDRILELGYFPEEQD